MKKLTLPSAEITRFSPQDDPPSEGVAYRGRQLYVDGKWIGVLQEIRSDLKYTDDRTQETTFLYVPPTHP